VPEQSSLHTDHVVRGPDLSIKITGKLNTSNAYRYLAGSRSKICCKRSVADFAQPPSCNVVPPRSGLYGRQHLSICQRVHNGESYASIKASICPLTNPLHSCLDRYSVPHWEGYYPDYFYELTPVLRLASAMLTHQDTLPFWHGLFLAGERYRREVVKPQFPLSTSSPD